jgi:hypothetical protein
MMGAAAGRRSVVVRYDVPPDDALGGPLGFIGGDGSRMWGSDHEALKAAVVQQFVTSFGPQTAIPRKVVVQERLTTASSHSLRCRVTASMNRQLGSLGFDW